MAESISVGEHAVVENLIARGYSRLRAEVLLVFVPLGLGRAIISRLLADTPIELPDTALIQEDCISAWLRDAAEYVVGPERG